ncbi:MAG: hypothetical protein KDB21_01435 [Acidimicrobiales bacterium]|nr:hypothetical protein [Acidimicrobiales bacterium]
MSEPGRKDPRFDRRTVEGRLAEMAWLDDLGQGEAEAVWPGHRYVTRNPAESAQQRAVLLARLAEAEARLENLAPHEL